MFEPIVPPPTEHHSFSTGLATEFGDNAKTVARKINDGFKHVYALLQEAGHTIGDAVEYVTAAAHKALNGRVDELEAEVRNLKMMVNGLGFAGARATGVAVSGEPLVTITDPGFTHTFTDPQATAGTGLTTETFLGSSEPVVTVSEATEQ